LDKFIGLDIEAVLGKGKKVSPNEVSTNLKNLGYNHAYRRGFLEIYQVELLGVKIGFIKNGV